MKLASIRLSRVHPRVIGEGIRLVGAGKVATMDFDFTQDRPDDSIRFTGHKLHGPEQLGGFEFYYSFQFVPQGERQDVQDIGQQLQQAKSGSSAAPTEKAVELLRSVPESVLLELGLDHEDETPYARSDLRTGADNAVRTALGGATFKHWLAANPERARSLFSGPPPGYGVPTSPKQFYQTLTGRIEQALEGVAVRQVLSARRQQLKTSQGEAQKAYKKAASLLANMIQDKGESNPNIDQLLNMAVEDLVDNIGDRFDTVVLPQSSNPTAMIIAKKIAEYTGAEIGRFQKPQVYGPGGLHFDTAAYETDYGKPLTDKTYMGNGYPLSMGRLHAQLAKAPGSFSMTAINKDMRKYWRNTQMVDEDWLLEHDGAKFLVVDDSVSSGSTMIAMAKQLSDWGSVLSYALLVIGT